MSTSPANTVGYDPDFSLLTSFAYDPSSSSSSSRTLLIDRHVSRLWSALRSLATLEPTTWCHGELLLLRHDDDSDREDGASERESWSRSIRTGERADSKWGERFKIRIVVPKTLKPEIQHFPLEPMPNYRVKLVLDDRATEYERDAFMRVKTTNRRKYDDARTRHGATLVVPSGEPDQDDDNAQQPPFDVVLFNARREVTETTISNVAFRFLSQGGRRWVTPSVESGLLAGTKRSELIESGQIEPAVVTVDQVLRAQRDGELEVICFNGVRGVFEAFIA
ncbi:hypothetical protein JCM3766R1_005967 [Sporobolomyces carnicolor]